MGTFDLSATLQHLYSLPCPFITGRLQHSTLLAALDRLFTPSWSATHSPQLLHYYNSSCFHSDITANVIVAYEVHLSQKTFAIALSSTRAVNCNWTIASLWNSRYFA